MCVLVLLRQKKHTIKNTCFLDQLANVNYSNLQIIQFSRTPIHFSMVSYPSFPHYRRYIQRFNNLLRDSHQRRTLQLRQYNSQRLFENYILRWRFHYELKNVLRLTFKSLIKREEYLFLVLTEKYLFVLKLVV